MIQLIKRLFKKGPSHDFARLVKEGALILDVRSEIEYRVGHMENALNFPVDQLQKHLSKMKKNQVIITCCASGRRSANAQKFLLSKGFEQVYNGGSWRKLQRLIQA